MTNDKLIIAGQEFNSRLLVGTGKYKDFQENKDAFEASGAEIVTVAVRRVNIEKKGVNKEFWHKRYYFNVAGHDIHFTDTQMTCLALLFERKTAKQIAQYLGLSFRTIQEHITAMRNKVGAQSSNDLYTILSKNDYVQLYCRLYRRHYEKRGVLWNY